MFFPYYGKKAQVSKRVGPGSSRPMAEADVAPLFQPDYVQPVVAVKLLLSKQDYNAELMVECKLEGTNLRNDDERDKSMGRVSFRVRVSE